jgi:hypothetical protein
MKFKNLAQRADEENKEERNMKHGRKNQLKKKKMAYQQTEKEEEIDEREI